uniref:Uncharacterized protein n=1 Tax=Noctiluca scintillans TaxID=2966 RepID=A0A7S1F2L1_NOCSC|mmetsp:Transcript_27/g.53  ORF Transcript_27/g.53 Transcript_27/m.53 type:complete len:278 (+) Transcript_27:71-904(+)
MAKRDATTEQRLDMSLDDLVGDPSYGPCRASTERRGPYRDRHEDGRGKGKGRANIPVEARALLHTRCFFNDDGDFVVRLHDTAVFTLQKRPEVADVDGKPASEAQGATLILTSGKFKTVQTRYILNLAMQPLSLRIENTNGERWEVLGDSIRQPFEDGMEVHLQSVVRASNVKEHLEEKIQAAKSKGQERTESRRDHSAHAQHVPQWQLGPPGWHGPPDWNLPHGLPPVHGAPLVPWHGHHLHPHQLFHHHPHPTMHYPGGRGSPQLSEPLPDSAFQ